MKEIACLSIIFSFRNEEDVLPELVRRTRDVMHKLQQSGILKNYELIFVNDASNDNSLTILHNLALGTTDIKIITMSRTFGVAPCVMAGLKYASGDAMIYMDADLQDPPEVIPAMIHAWQQDREADVVHTTRRSRKGESSFKMFLTKIGYLILNRYSNVPIPQEAGDFKLLSRRVANHLLELKENKPFMRGLVSWVGFKQIFVPYDREARFAGKSKFFILGRKAVSNFLNAAVVNFSSVPLQIASYCGLAAILIDVLLVIHTLYQKATNHAVPGWSALMIAILFIGGVQLFCIGMIGLYLNSVHEQGKMRPNYIVSSTYGFQKQDT